MEKPLLWFGHTLQRGSAFLKCGEGVVAKWIGTLETRHWQLGHKVFAKCKSSILRRHVCMHSSTVYSALIAKVHALHVLVPLRYTLAFFSVNKSLNRASLSV